MGQKKKPAARGRKPAPRYWKFVPVVADHGKGRTLARDGGYDPWFARLTAEYHGTEVRTLWTELPQTTEFPLSLLLRVPAWAAGVEIARRSVHGAYVVVPHHEPDTLPDDDGNEVPVADLPDSTPAHTL